MAGAGKKWLIGCGVGCGGFILLGILGMVVGGILMSRPMSNAVDTQVALTEAYGSRGAYIPPASGITADRMEVFLAVRDSLMWQCANFQEIADRFEEMDALDNDEDASTGEALKAVGGLMGSITGMVGEMGRFTADRNRVLLELEMSHGEYMWIYVLAYHSWLGYPPGTTFEAGEDGELSLSERRDLRSLMDNHAQALREAGQTAEADRWDREVVIMERSEGSVPFANGDIPEELVAAFTPYRERLEKIYCPQTAGIELNQIKKKGLSFHAN